MMNNASVQTKRDFTLIELLVLSVLAAVVLPGATTRCIAAELPNIVIVYTDDLGYGDLSIYNPEAAYKTPRIDRMAREGIMFTDAHSPSTICSPSRYGLFSGQQIYRSTGRGGGAFEGPGGPSYLKPGTLTLGDMLRSKGYRTGVFGKWHVGLTWYDDNGKQLKGGFANSKLINYEKSTPLIDGPNNRGFDESFVTPNCPNTDPLYVYIENGMVKTPATVVHRRSNLPNLDGWLWDNDEGFMSVGYDFENADKIFYDKTMEFITNHLDRHPDKPFFAVLSTQIAHAPVLPATEFRGKTEGGPRGDFVWELDVLVGRLLDKLQQLGIDENTLVLFNSDNGAETVHYHRMLQEYKHDASGRWRGMKRDGWEGGHRVPFIARWPRAIPAGQVSKQMTNTTDIFATLASLVGYELKDEDATDSFDMLPVMLGIQDEGKPIRPHLLTQSFRGQFQIRQGQWKYLDHMSSGGNNYSKGFMPQYLLPETAPDATGQLFHLGKDPGETTNLFFEESRKRKELQELLQTLKASGRSAPKARKPIGIENIPLISRKGKIETRKEDTETLRVFIFAGQSNMVGTHSSAKDVKNFPPFAGCGADQTEVKYSYAIGREDMMQSTGWTTLKPVNNVVGPELSFGQKVSQDIEAPIAIIKCASGGTSLESDWNPDNPSGFKLYPIALKLVKDSLKALDDSKTKYRVEGFMWHQGESDMLTPEYKPKYAGNLKNFIARWRTDLNLPGLRFYIGELCCKTVWGMDNRRNMYDLSLAQKEVCEEDDHAEYIPTNHVGVRTKSIDGLHYHYGTLGQLEHGHNYATAYLSSIGKLETVERPFKKWPYKKRHTVKLFILAGHRNMEGEISFVEALKSLEGHSKLAKDNQKVAFSYSLGGGYKVSEGWEPLGPAGMYGTFGPELSLASNLRKKTRGKIAIAKFTHSGSQINDWTPEGSHAESRNLYPPFIAFIQSQVKDLEDRGHKVKIEGIFYHVGENDMSYSPYKTNAAKWVKSFVEQSRKDLNQEDLKWFISQQPPTKFKGANETNVMGQLEDWAKTDTNTFHVEALGLVKEDEHILMDTEAVVKLGLLLSDSYLTQQGKDK